MAWSRHLVSSVVLAGLVLAVGCGGNTRFGHGGTGGAAATGGSGAGGSSGSGAGGSGATAGSAGTGGSSGTGGTGGNGGTGGTGGVGGNCGASAKTCALTSDCILTDASCCICSTPKLSDEIAINKAHQNSCLCQGPGCGCAAAPNPDLGATCKAGTCTGFDVQQVDVLSACSSDTDCMLRIGLGCCPGCQSGGFDVIALRADAESALEKLVCDNGAPQGCPGCIPSLPSNMHASCVQGRCTVVTQ